MKILKYLIIAYFSLFLLVNLSALKGLFIFINSYISYEYKSENPVGTFSEFDAIYKMTELSSTEICEFIKKELDSAGVHYETQQLGNRQQNIFIPGQIDSEFSLITAHYDKDRESKNYKGALDNLASTTILLNLIKENYNAIKSKRIAFLFTGLEERGLKGASKFMFLANRKKLKIKEVICLDGVGRGKVAVMRNARRFGFKFRNLLFKETLYNGHKFSKCPTYETIRNEDVNLDYKEVVFLNSFLSSTDSYVFSKNGIPTVNLTSSNIYHFLNVLHTNKDRVECLDENTLITCKSILTDFLNKH